MIALSKEDITNNVAVSGDFDPTVLAPFVGPAERRYLRPILGVDMLRELESYAIGERNDEVLETLLSLYQRARVLLAFDIGYPQLSVKITSYGTSREESESNKTLFGYQERSLRESFREGGLNAIEDIISHLEESINDQALAKWKNSAVCANMNSMLINSAAEFTTYYAPLANSRLAFLNLISSQQYVMDQVIEPLLPATLYQDIRVMVRERKAQLEENKDKRELLGNINKALAFLTIADAASTIGIKFSDRGLFFSEELRGEDSVQKSEKAAEKVVNDAKEKGQAYLSQLKKYLILKGITSDSMPGSTGFDFFVSDRKIVRL